MADATIAAPLAADITGYLDPLGTWFKNRYPQFGLGAPGESNTFAKDAITGRTKIEGDGTTSFPGIQNAGLKQRGLPFLNDIVKLSRYDSQFNLMIRSILGDLDAYILNNLPSRSTSDAWQLSGANNERALDLFLLRMNGNPGSNNAPAAPTWTPTLNATTGGQRAPTTAGQEPRVKVAYVGAKDYYESQPSAASAQVALSGKNNAWYLTDPGGNVPTGVKKLRVYCQYDANAGSGDPFGWDQDLPVSEGTAWSTYLGANGLKIKNADQALRMDWRPALWLSCLLMPEHAFLLAIALAQVSDHPGEQTGLMKFGNAAFPSAAIVALNPANGFLGINNPASTAELARWAATVFTEGSIRTANDAAQALQGFAGCAGGVRARVVSALNAGATFTNLRYYYYDAANPFTLQNVTVSPAGTLSSGAGSVLDLAITAGRLVTRIDQVTVGGATTGTIVFEAIPLRTL